MRGAFLFRRHRRRRLSMSARLLVFVLVILLATTITPGPNAQANDANLRIAMRYAADYGVTLGEAQRRLGLQDLAGQLDATLQVAQPGTFAGLWIEHRPAFRVVVSFTATSTLSQYVTGGPLASVSEARQAAVPLAQLRADIAGISKVAPHAPLEAGITVQENRIDVYVTSREQFEAFVRRTGFRLPATATIRVVPALSKSTLNIYGGLPLDGNGCTSGFSVYHNETGMRGVTTAGHCANTASYAGSNLPFQAESYGGSHDEQWHSAPGFTVKNWVNDGVDVTEITSRTFWASQSVGQYVCKYGRSTFSTCGTIQQKDYAPGPGCVPNGAATWVRVKSDTGADMMEPGDSGGPVFKGNSAYGVANCEYGTDENQALYVAVDYVESGLSVTVLTTP